MSVTTKRKSVEDPEACLHAVESTGMVTKVLKVSTESPFLPPTSHVWERFMAADWPERDELITYCVEHWDTKDKAISNFLSSYQLNLVDIFLPSFYAIVNSDDEIAKYAKEYATTGEINVPLLNLSCLSQVAEWAEEKEKNGNGNNRYGTTRYVYPPGEAQRFDDSDPRKALRSQVNLCAIGAKRHMSKNDIVQWIYHSPHLQRFIKGIMEFKEIYPYNSDIGVAVNVNRSIDEFKQLQTSAPENISNVSNESKSNGEVKEKEEEKKTNFPQTALGFHFDSIDSSIQQSLSSINQARGATGVIGIQDCKVGGERITFPTISREEVSQVRSVLHNFDPLKPTAALTDEDGSSLIPQVVEDSIAGVLSVFNGGDVLHAVSSVREGVRVATVFLYAEQQPTMDATTKDNCDAFYGKKA